MQTPVPKPLLVGKWAIGHKPDLNLTFLRLEFTDHEPIDLAIPFDVSAGIAAALIEHQKLREWPAHRH